MREVGVSFFQVGFLLFKFYFDQRERPDRSYKAMWEKYSGRVLLAMSAQAFAQLVSLQNGLGHR